MLEKTLEKLISIPSHSGDEILIAKYLFEEAVRVSKNHRIIVQEYSDLGRNVLVLAQRTKLLIDVHLDTVPPGDRVDWKSEPLSLTENEGRLLGLGAADVKSGLAVCLELLRTVDCNEVSFVFCGGEETGGQGLEFAMKSGAVRGMPLAVVMEPTGLDVGIAHKSCFGVQITFQGKSAHASTPWLGDNAIIHVNRFLNIFHELFQAWKQKHLLLGEDTFNVGIVRGGDVMNIVPDRCSLGIDMRLVPGQTTESVQRFLDEVVEKSESKCTMDIRCYPALEYMGTDGIPQEIAQKTGGKLEQMPYWSHGGLYQEAGIPAVLFGPGSIGQAHQPNEYVRKDQLNVAYQALKSIIENL